MEDKRYVFECVRIAEYQMSKGRHFLFEAPPTATTYNLRPMERLMQNPKVFTGITSGCRVGLRHPISGLLLSKRWKFVSSSPEAARELTPPCCGGHAHVRTEGGSPLPGLG
eukprot:2388349-Pyramimonas_sp.AAC.1